MIKEQWSKFKLTTLDQYRRLFEAFNTLGFKGVNQVLFQKKGEKSFSKNSVNINNAFDRSTVLLIDVFLLLIIVGMSLMVMFSIAYAIREAIARNVDYDKLPYSTSRSRSIVGKRRPFIPKGCADPRFKPVWWHSACTRASIKFIRSVNFTDRFRKRLIETHMKERRTLKNSNMKRIYYDLNLEQTAERYAAKCIFRHDRFYQRADPIYDGYIGQNIGYISINKDSPWKSRIFEIINHFASEKTDFVYGKGSPSGAVIGHYVQMITADTIRMGCGEAHCTDKSMVVCNYYESVKSTEYPYKQGSTCSNCSKDCPCWDSLCDCGDSLGN
ncbi:hypothetical protein SNEBB_008502 [Seison nebaliae]|nr:hypothetical protein SNEBB_008502 [Seison nebaliae]